MKLLDTGDADFEVYNLGWGCRYGSEPLQSRRAILVIRKKHGIRNKTN